MPSTAPSPPQSAPQSPAPLAAPPLDPTRPLKVTGAAFSACKFDLYPHLLEHHPVSRGSIFGLKIFLVARHADCLALLKDPRFVRNRSHATGGSRMPFPAPRTLRALGESMILEDGAPHRRLRGLVNRAFTPRAVASFEHRIEALSHELLDAAEKRCEQKGGIDLIADYGLPIPMAVIAQMMGVDEHELPRLHGSIRALSEGMSGWNVLRTFLFDIRKTARFYRELIQRKRREPGEDILSRLIEAEEEGDRLSDQELLAMTFLLIIAGFETTAHLIANGVVALVQHPEELEKLREQPDLMDSTVEEMLRYAGPIHGTKLHYATEPVTLHGRTLPKGAMVSALLGAANRDPRVFKAPERFDIARDPNPHLGFGHGEHYCLGAQLARLETKIAVRNLLERAPNLRLAVPASELVPQRMALWHRYERVPVALG